jgi:electron transfer flavoprotein-quinone oxidoreductase
MMPKLFTGGMLVAGDSAGLVLATGTHIEGVNFAIASGVTAAETVKAAHAKGDFSSATLGQYETLLKESFVLKDLDQFKRVSDFLANERVHNDYPLLASEILRKIFTSDGKPRPNALAVARKIATERVSVWNLLKDAMAARRSL